MRAREMKSLMVMTERLTPAQREALVAVFSKKACNRRHLRQLSLPRAPELGVGPALLEPVI